MESLTTQSTPRLISAAEVARQIRSELKAAYGSQWFSVRTSTFAGGSSVIVSWTGGPEKSQVRDEVLKRYDAVETDALDDSVKYGSITLWSGEVVWPGMLFVRMHRAA